MRINEGHRRIWNCDRYTQHDEVQVDSAVSRRSTLHILYFWDNLSEAIASEKNKVTSLGKKNLKFIVY